MRLNFFYISIVLLCLAMQYCKSQKQALYEFPDQMLPHVKIGYAEICAKGKILYDLNCAKCHTTKVRRKEIIPDFKEEQLNGYALRISNAKHEETLPDEQVSAEELGQITTFLKYKVKNKIKETKK
jgi:hypothetical protein